VPLRAEGGDVAAGAATEDEDVALHRLSAHVHFFGAELQRSVIVVALHNPCQ
jgi:hypothetical protein